LIVPVAEPELPALKKLNLLQNSVGELGASLLQQAAAKLFQVRKTELEVNIDLNRVPFPDKSCLEYANYFDHFHLVWTKEAAPKLAKPPPPPSFQKWPGMDSSSATALTSHVGEAWPPVAKLRRSVSEAILVGLGPAALRPAKDSFPKSRRPTTGELEGERRGSRAKDSVGAMLGQTF